MGLQLRTRLSNGIGNAVENVLTASLSLHKSLLKDVERQTVALDIHLGSGQTGAHGQP